MKLSGMNPNNSMRAPGRPEVIAEGDSYGESTTKLHERGLDSRQFLHGYEESGPIIEEPEVRIGSLGDIRAGSSFFDGGIIQSRVNKEILAPTPFGRTDAATLDRDGSKSKEQKNDSRVKIIDIRNINQGYGRTGWDGKKIRSKKHPTEASPRKNNTRPGFYKNPMGKSSERDIHGTKLMSDMNFYHSNKQSPRNKSPQANTVNLGNWSNQISQRKYHNLQDYSKLRLGLGFFENFNEFIEFEDKNDYFESFGWQNVKIIMDNIVEERAKYEKIESIYVREAKKFMESIGFVAGSDGSIKNVGQSSPEKGTRKDPNLVLLMNQTAT